MKPNHLLFVLSIMLAGCQQDIEDSISLETTTALAEFFSVNAGEKPARGSIEIPHSESKLPYSYFTVELPNKSVESTYKNYSISINKKTGIVHSKIIKVPAVSIACKSEKDELITLLKINGFNSTKTSQVANPFGRISYINEMQVAIVSCIQEQGSTIFEAELKVTTNEEHSQFEKTMQEFAANK